MKLLVYLFFASLLVGQLPSLFGLHVYAHDVMLGILLLSYIIFYHRRKQKRPKLLLPILLFIGSGLISGGNYLYLGRWAFYALLYFLVVQKIIPVKMWLRGLWYAGMGLAILGILQFLLYPDFRNLYYLGWDPYYFRLVSTLFDPNFTGIILVLTVLLGSTRDWLLLPTILLTFSRSSFLGLFVGLFIQKRWKVLFGFLILLIVTMVVPKPPFEAFRLTREVSTIARVNNWQQSLDVFLKSPVIGRGFPARLSGGAGIDNSFLFVLVSSGIVGFSAFVWLWWNIVKFAKGVLLASIAAVFVSSLFVNSLFYPWIMIWLWILIGTAEAL